MNQIAPMSSDAIAKAVTLEAEMRKLNTQVNLATSHLIHAGLYHRTVFIPIRRSSSTATSPCMWTAIQFYSQDTMCYLHMQDESKRPTRTEILTSR